MGFAHPEMLVTTDWVKEHLNDPKIKLVEVDVDTTSYDAGHIPGAIAFNWQSQLQDQVRRDIISKDEFEKLNSEAGICDLDTVILYGDNSNWFAAYALWLYKLYGHSDVRLMDGGRIKWLNEDDKPMTTEVPSFPKTNYKVSGMNGDLRAFVPDVMEASKTGTANLVDVRSVDEFTGKVIAPPGMSETAQRGGHVPGAKNVPWSKAVREDGSFKPAEDLKALYFQEAGVDGNKPTIAYCRIGERSSHTWFVLKYLLGQNNVKNYDGSWTEYGNLISAPIDKG